MPITPQHYWTNHDKSLQGRKNQLGVGGSTGRNGAAIYQVPVLPQRCMCVMCELAVQEISKQKKHRPNKNMFKSNLFGISPVQNLSRVHPSFE